MMRVMNMRVIYSDAFENKTRITQPSAIATK